MPVAVVAPVRLAVLIGGARRNRIATFSLTLRVALSCEHYRPPTLSISITSRQVLIAGRRNQGPHAPRIASDRETRVSRHSPAESAGSWS